MQNDKRVRILTVFGTRPEAIKLAPVVDRLRRVPGVHTGVCVTAQHRDMLDQALAPFGIEPDYDLNLMQRDQTLTALASAVLHRLESVLYAERPDWVVVQGDTTTAALAALAAFYQQRRVAHVEAGLRSHDKWQPFPEEINRRIAGVIADLHFAPTEGARQNLLREGVPESAVRVTGNTIIDALRQIERFPWSPLVLGKRAAAFVEPDTVSDVTDAASVPRYAASALKKNGAASAIDGAALSGVRKDSPRLILVTAHRRENFGEPILHICEALKRLASRYPNLRLVYPVHRNPHIWEPVHGLLRDVPNILLLPPVDYISLIHLMKRSWLVLTDSGGIQEEAPALGVPALVFREVTERPEGVVSGNVKLVGCNPQRILWETIRLLEDSHEYARMARAVNPYGDGHAADRIAHALTHEHLRPSDQYGRPERAPRLAAGQNKSRARGLSAPGFEATMKPRQASPDERNARELHLLPTP